MMGALDIGWAIRGLRLGKKVRRRGWRDKRKFLWFKPPVQIQADWCKDPKLKKLAEDNGGAIDGLGTICMYLVVDDVPMILTGWHPTPCDLLAEDWEEAEWASQYDKIERDMATTDMDAESKGDTE